IAARCRPVAARLWVGLHPELWFCVLAAAFIATSARALTLGDLSPESGLGQPLRAVVPMAVQPGDEIVNECIRLSPAMRTIDGIPELNAGRVAIEQIGSQAQLVISSKHPINDPVLRIAVQTGCERDAR